MLRIPSSDSYRSLNLSHAVTLVLYALFVNKDFKPKHRRNMGKIEKEKLFDYFAQLLENINYPQHKKEKTKIFTIKTQVGKEQNTADMINSRATKSKIKIPSILVTPDLRGYLFLEAYDKERIKEMIKTISYARNILEGDIPIEQIKHFLVPASAVAKIAEGDVVEMVSGPFRGETAKVTHIDDTKEEITVELFESVVPIPITVRGEQVRVIKRKEDEKKKEEKKE
jgi:transcriptional antiterminator NusG